MKELSYNEEEFKENAKKLAKKHQIPIEIMEQWLKESYDDISKQFIRKLSGKKDKKKRQPKVEEILPNNTDWMCPFCGSINKELGCSGCDAVLDVEKDK